jgi:GTPase SAR1 family protein
LHSRLNGAAIEPVSGSYASLRHELARALDAVGALLDETGQELLDSRPGTLADKVERERFHLAVLGQFKRGKTTFINSLLGADLLPTGVLPLTSIVTMIEYGTAPAACVYFRDGRTHPIAMDAIAAFVTERENPANRKQVARVVVAHPASILRDGVVLIDTPGIGSTYEHNTDATYAFLPEVDAAIFVASVDPPLSRAEKDFLIAVREHAAKLFFVLNKIDYVDTSEARQLLEFLGVTLANELGIVAPRIFPLSARRALSRALEGGPPDAGLREFQAALGTFLMREKGAVALTAASRSALRILQEARLLIDIQMKALAIPVQELERKLTAFDQLRIDAELEQRDFEQLLKGEAQRLLGAVDDYLTVLKAEATPALEQSVRACAEAHGDLKGRRLAQALQEELKRLLVQTFEVRRRRQEQHLDDEFRCISERFVGDADRIIERLVELSAALFALPSIPAASTEGLSADSRLYYMVGDQPVLLGIEPLYFSTLLPNRLTRRFVVADALRQVPIEVERNCGRLRYDFLLRIEQSMTRFSRQLAERIRVTSDGIRSAIAAAVRERQRNRANFETRRAELQRQHQRLGSAEAEISRIRDGAAAL